MDSERAGATLKIGFVTDIHEDAASLVDALLLLEKHKCECVCCLGDITGFSELLLTTVRDRNRRECIRLISENCHLTVTGNHDLHTLERVTSFRAGSLLREDWYSQSLKDRKNISKGTVWLYEDELISPPLSPEESAFLCHLPETASLHAADQHLLLSHFAYPDISGSTKVLPNTHLDVVKHLQYMQLGGFNLSFSGHGHPEGVILCSDKRMDYHGFGLIQLNETIKWVVLPPVVRSNRRSGVTIFDSDLKTLLTLELYAQ